MDSLSRCPVLEEGELPPSPVCASEEDPPQIPIFEEGESPQFEEGELPQSPVRSASEETDSVSDAATQDFSNQEPSATEDKIVSRSGPEQDFDQPEDLDSSRFAADVENLMREVFREQKILRERSSSIRPVPTGEKTLRGGSPVRQVPTEEKILREGSPVRQTNLPDTKISSKISLTGNEERSVEIITRKKRSPDRPAPIDQNSLRERSPIRPTSPPYSPVLQVKILQSGSPDGGDEFEESSTRRVTYLCGRSPHRSDELPAPPTRRVKILHGGSSESTLAQRGVKRPQSGSPHRNPGPRSQVVVASGSVTVGTGITTMASDETQVKRRRSSSPQLEGISQLCETTDWAFFIEMNFLLAAYKSRHCGYESLGRPLSLTRLRPKEVSVVRVSGLPHHRHWVVNYLRFEGHQSRVDNGRISSLHHGMVWRSIHDETIVRFDKFFSGLRRLVFRHDNYEAKLYTTDPTVKEFLENACEFKNVVLLKPEKIDFDPWIGHCQHHPGIQVSSRPCTENRVWALRHRFGKEVSCRL